MNQVPHSLEYSSVLSDGTAFHYTCNSPPMNVLDKYNIEAIGENFGVQPREVLRVPSKLVKQCGLDVNSSQVEIVLAMEYMLRKLK